MSSPKSFRPLDILVAITVLGLLAGHASAQSDSIELKTSDTSSQVPRLVVTTSTGVGNLATVRVEKSRFSFSTDGVLQIGTNTPATPAAGDIRYSGGDVLYYDGGSWKTLAASGGGGFVELGPAAAQAYTGANSLIHLNESGGSSPNLLELEMGGVDKMVVTNTGQLRLLGDDLFTDRWTGTTSNTLLGVDVAGSDAMLAGAAGNTGFGFSVMKSLTSGDWNTAIGSNTMRSNQDGHSNVAIGDEALFSNTSGDYIVAIGRYALRASTTANDNVAVGGNALRTNTGSGNTGIGGNALYANIGGTGLTGVGANAGRLNTSGNNNTCIGVESGYNNLTGGSNTVVGYRANYGGPGINTAGCVAVGCEALYSNESNYNVAVGYRALYANTDGILNLAMGRYALDGNTTGDYNTAVGHEALSAAMTSSQNTALGFRALNQTTGSWNTGIGSNALQTNTGGNYNTAVGGYALLSNNSGSSNTAVGQSAGYRNTTCSRNALLGYYANYNNQTGNYNVIIGYYAAYGSGAHSKSNNVVIGCQAGYNLDAGDDGNICIGYRAGYNETGSNKLYIENSDIANPLIWGDFSSNYVNINGSLGINDSTPAEALDVNGRVRIAQLAAPGTTTDKLYNDSGDLYWNGNKLAAGGSSGCAILSFAATSSTIFGGDPNEYLIPGAFTGGTTPIELFMVVPRSGTLKNLYVITSTSDPDATADFIVRINGADTSLKATLNTGTTATNDTSNSAAVSAGDKISVAVKNNHAVNGFGVNSPWASFEFTD